MARPRRDEQDVLLQRVATALAERDDPRPWTLAEIAPAVGLSPAGLLKRFGSRHGVLVALSEAWVASVPTDPCTDLDPRDELRDWAEQRYAAVDSNGLAQGLVQLVDDLVDAELRTMVADGWRRERAYVAALLDAAGLPPAKLETYAAIVCDALQGAMIRNAADPDLHHITRTLDTLLEAWT